MYCTIAIYLKITEELKASLKDAEHDERFSWSPANVVAEDVVGQLLQPILDRLSSIIGAHALVAGSHYLLHLNHSVRDEDVGDAVPVLGRYAEEVLVKAAEVVRNRHVLGGPSGPLGRPRHRCRHSCAVLLQ